MTRSVEVVIRDETTPIASAGFGLALVFADDVEYEYDEITSTADIDTDIIDTDHLAYEMVQRFFEQEPNYGEIAIYGADVQGDEELDYEDALNDLAIDHNDWYFLLFANRDASDIADVASWAGANEKLMITQPNHTLSVADITAMSDTIASNRVGVYAHDGGRDEEDQHLDAGIVGKMSSFDAGQATWKFKGLNGVSVATYENSDINEFHDANINTYIREMGRDFTSEGYHTDGGFLDITRSIDWLKARIQEEIFFLLINQDKVAYDDKGIAQVVAQLRGVLQRATGQGIIARDIETGDGLWEIDYPSRSEIADTDLADRLLPDIYFEATVAGAVHEVEVEGVLKV